MTAPICPHCGKPKSARPGKRSGTTWWRCAPCQNERCRERYHRYRLHKKLGKAAAPEPVESTKIPVPPPAIAARPEPEEKLEKPRMARYKDWRDYWDAERVWPDIGTCHLYYFGSDGCQPRKSECDPVMRGGNRYRGVS